jgi:phage-related protein (TIGR01555 family)
MQFPWPFRRRQPEPSPQQPVPFAGVAAKPARHKGTNIPEGFAIAPPADPYRHKLALPDVPKEVHGSEPRFAMDDAGGGGFPYAGFLNTAGVLGAFGLYFPGYPYLAELAQRSEFRQPTETTAKEMTRKWISLKSKSKADKSEQIKQLEDDLEEFKVQSLFRKVTEYDGFYGMGFLFIDIDQQENTLDLPLPIDEKTIAKGSLRGFTAIEPMWTTPLVWNSTDPTKPNFYKPDSWMVLGKKVNATRLIRFVSREVPDIIKPAYNFGGISLSQLIQPYVDRWLKTVGSVNRLINNFSIIFLQTDMDAILEGGLAGQNELRKRIEMFIRFRDNQGMFATDKEREGLEQLAVPLSGLSELQAQAQEHQAAPTHLPLVVLTGITPAGLNASSDSELEVFHDWINASQECLYRDALTKVLHILQLNRGGKIDPDIVIDFVSLKQLTGEALARVKKTQSEMDVGYIDDGVVSPEEVRERIARDPDSGYDNLSTEMPEDLKAANEARLENELNPPQPGGDEPDGDEPQE